MTSTISEKLLLPYKHLHNILKLSTIMCYNSTLNPWLQPRQAAYIFHFRRSDRRVSGAVKSGELDVNKLVKL